MDFNTYRELSIAIGQSLTILIGVFLVWKIAVWARYYAKGYPVKKPSDYDVSLQTLRPFRPNEILEIVAACFVLLWVAWVASLFFPLAIIALLVWTPLWFARRRSLRANAAVKEIIGDD